MIKDATTSRIYDKRYSHSDEFTRKSSKFEVMLKDETILTNL